MTMSRWLIYLVTHLTIFDDINVDGAFVTQHFLLWSSYYYLLVDEI